MQTSQEILKPTKAVAYCRVSGTKQVREGHGLESQEARCREFANYKEYKVVEVFKEDMTGKTANRPAMNRMLSFLRLHPKGSVVVIIDDISRLARNLKAHISLRETLAAAGGVLESPSIEFGEDSDSLLVEHIRAVVSAHQSDKNAEQTTNRMRGRIMNGYWVFRAPIGLRFEIIEGHGKLLVRDEPNASIVQEALEGYASGRFETQAEIKRFLESQPLFPKDLPNGKVRQQKVTDILNRVIYAGYVERPKWDIALRKGHHEGLISLETFEKIQDKRNGRVKAPARKDINIDFPLRGFVECADCGKPHTACWSTSSTGVKHPYYSCKTKGCDSFRKSIRRDVIEGEFEEVLRALKPSEGLLEIMKSMFKDAWDQRQEQASATLHDVRKESRKLDKQIEGMLDRIVAAKSESVISAYEKRIEKLEREKMVMSEKLENKAKPVHSFTEMFELSLKFIANPWNIWASGQLSLKRTVLKLAFSERIAYSRKTGLRTPQVSVPFEFFGGHIQKCEMVPPHGLEPRTY
ncbi:MAG: recombinase family protein [Rhodobacteraceae bacterium]|nr:recombinase family protein [Paracoccaceae bacterium]